MNYKQLKHNIIIIVCSALLLFTTSNVAAQCNIGSNGNDSCCQRKAIPSRITNFKSWEIGLGQRKFLDTYLSQEHYSGLDFTLTAERQHLNKRKSMVWKSEGSIDFATMDNRADNNKTIELMGEYRLLMLHYWQLMKDRLWIAAGGGVSVTLGGAYNMRNQNNPAQLRIAPQLVPNVEIIYALPMRRNDWIVRYNITVPVVGLQFSPKYGQSYYEISQENALKNFSMSTFVNSLSLRHQLTVDIPISKSYLRIGFLGNYRQNKINKLKYHSYENAFIIGYSKSL